MRQTLKFSVDSRLLRELGERLVGKPHMALAELVKNSYDADARNVVIRFLDDVIEVADDGHGMDVDDFETRWMRIGADYKAREATSPRFERPLTGSKGVGRLAVQLLAADLTIRSVADPSASVELEATVDWDRAVRTGLLTEAPVTIDDAAPRTTRFPENSPTGTSLVLRNLNQRWAPAEFEDLASENLAAPATVPRCRHQGRDGIQSHPRKPVPRCGGGVQPKDGGRPGAVDGEGGRRALAGGPSTHGRCRPGPSAQAKRLARERGLGHPR